MNRFRWCALVALAGLTACATHKDLLYTFTISGSVKCSGQCDEIGPVSVRALDTGLTTSAATSV